MARARKQPSLPASFDAGSPRRFMVPRAHLTSACDARGDAISGPRARGDATVAGARAAIKTVLEPLAGDANKRRRRREIHPLDVMEKKHMLTPWQADAGRKLLDAWEATMTTPSGDYADPRVDTTPNPEARTTALLVRQERFAKMRKAMPRESQGLVEHVVMQGRYLRDGFAKNARDTRIYLDQLRLALDVLADHLGLR